MVVMTAKVSKTKLIAAVLALAAVICGAVFLLRNGKSGESKAENAPVATNEDRVKFLAAYGWEVSEQPAETQNVTIPAETNEVFEQYNALQRSQGFDLTRFAGRQVHRYVYEIRNYTGADAPVYATLLVYRGAVIGGDVTNTAGSGSMHGLTPPDGVLPPA